MFCKNCGSEVADGEKFCAKCGAAVENAAASDFQNKVKDVLNSPDSTADFDAADIEGNKILSLFAYIGILFLIPLLACKDSKYARFHTNQGIVLFITGIVLSIATIIVTTILAFIPILGIILAPIVSLAVSVAMLALCIIGIVNAVTGKAKELPVIGKFKILK